MYKCEEILGKIEEYIENDLSKKDMRIVEEHIRKCPSCKKELEFAKSIRSALKEVEFPEPPIDFLERVNLKLDKEIRKTVFVKRMFSFRTCTTVAACIMIALFMGLNEEEEFVKNFENDTVVESSALPTLKSEAEGFTVEQATEETAEEIAVAEETAGETEAWDEASEAETEIAAEAESQPSEEVSAVVEETQKPAEKKVEKTAAPTRRTTAPAREVEKKKEDSSTPKPFSTPVTTPVAENDNKKSDTSDKASGRSAENNAGTASYSLRAYSAEDDGNASGGGSSGKNTSTGKVYVDSEDIGTASSLATSYGSIEGGVYKMDSGEYQKFVSAMDKKGIDNFSETSSVGGIYSFQIISK